MKTMKALLNLYFWVGYARGVGWLVMIKTPTQEWLNKFPSYFISSDWFTMLHLLNWFVTTMLNSGGYTLEFHIFNNLFEQIISKGNLPPSKSFPNST